jgi:hypothetical protein
MKIRLYEMILDEAEEGWHNSLAGFGNVNREWPMVNNE